MKKDGGLLVGERSAEQGRERKIALQRLEEVVMWANKAIAFEGADQ